jgi:hypothetical protein
MEPKIIFAPSAFRHRISEADIRRAFVTHIRDVLMDEYEDAYALIGFDTKGNTLEIMYNLIDNQTREVFHAMRCRKSFQKKYGIKGEDHATFD